jgi:hypothetical protein
MANVNINIPSEVTQTITDGVTTTAPSENAVFDALALKANSADLALVATTGDYNDLDNLPTLNNGTVTSVDLTMPPAFSVSGNPVTSSGTLAVAAAGLSSQYIRGDGQLANFPTSSGGGSSVNFYLNGSVAQGTLGGVAFKQMSSTPVIGTGTDFTINADGYIQSFITDASVPNQLAIPGGNWNFEMYFSASSNGGTPRFYLELYKLSGGTLTLLASSSATPEFITNGTQIDLYTTALAVPSTVLLAADRLAIRVYVIHSSRTITLHTENSHLCQVITTFSTGLTALNGLTSQVQNLAVGTSGTDFAISSATNTHTFNLPTASASNRGALSTTDWSAFNGKQAALVSGTNIKTINGNTLLGSGDLVISGGGGITVGTTAVTSGTIGRVFFQGTGNVVQQSASLFWDNTNGRLNLGAVGTNSARLDIKSPGALSTDIALRVRNSADSANILTVQGNGTIVIPSNPKIDTTAGTFIQTNTFGSLYVGTGNTSIANYTNTVFGNSNTLSGSVDNYVVVGSSNSINGMRNIVMGINNTTSGDSSIRIGNAAQDTYGGNSSIHLGKSGNGGFINYSANEVFNVFFNDYRQSQMFRGNGSLLLSGKNNTILTDANVTTFMGDGGNTLVVRNHTSVPSTNITDSFQQYSADITAGNAAPHFRTENGDVIKLYRQSSTGILTVPQLVAVLQNLGLLS